MTKNFSYELKGTGWSETIFDNGKQIFSIETSYLSEPLTDLLKSLSRLINNESYFEKIIFANEPGEHCLTIIKGENDVLNIEIFWSEEWDETFNPPKNLNNKKIVYSDDDSLENFTNVILNGINNLMQNLSLKDYKTQWCSPFPSKIFKELSKRFSNVI